MTAEPPEDNKREKFLQIFKEQAQRARAANLAAANDAQAASAANGAGAGGDPTYSLEETQAAVEAAGKKDAARVLANMLPLTRDVDPIAKNELIDRAQKISGLGKRVITQQIKQVQAKQDAAERTREQLASGKPIITHEPNDLPKTTDSIGRHLRDPSKIGFGSILNRGLVPVVLRLADETAGACYPRSDVKLTPGTPYLKSAVSGHMQILIDEQILLEHVTGVEIGCPPCLAYYTLCRLEFLQITSIARTPVIREDGSILTAPGYDTVLQLYYWPSADFLPVPDHPTQEDAAAALEKLREPFRDFPFATDIDRDAVIAELLTVMARHLIDMAPGFVHNAREAGTGKTILFEMIALIATGQTATLRNAEKLADETELRKQLTAIVFEGVETLAVFDNAPRGEVLTSPSLSHFLTSAKYGDRLLGSTADVYAPNKTVIGITGNAVEVAGDLTRRILQIDLDAEVERPELREFSFDPKVEVEENRLSLVQSALIILRAHALAGRPRVPDRPPLGSFGRWDQIVAGAITFAGGHDVVTLMEKTRSVDPERNDVFEVFKMLCGIGAVDGHAMTSGKIITAVSRRASEDDDDGKEWLEMILRISGDQRPNSRKLGHYLAKNSGRHIGGLMLISTFDSASKVKKYTVHEAPKKAV